MFFSYPYRVPPALRVVNSNPYRHQPVRRRQCESRVHVPADLYLFGMLQSAMFTAWVAAVSGRLKSDFQIAPGTVYNTFSFPSLDESQRGKIAEACVGVKQDGLPFEGPAVPGRFATGRRHGAGALPPPTQCWPSPFKVSLHEPDQGEMRMGFGVIRIEPDRLLMASDSLIRISDFGE